MSSSQTESGIYKEEGKDGKGKRVFSRCHKEAIFLKSRLDDRLHSGGGLATLPKGIGWGKAGSTNKARIREKYRGLSRQELLDKAYEQGANYERYSTGCAQGAIAGLSEILDINDVVVKVATSSCGGQAAMAMGTCGGLIGGTMILDYFLGRSLEGMSNRASKKADSETQRDAVRVAKLLYDKYIKEYGTILCPAIQQQLFGRQYYFLDLQEYMKFEMAGGHSDPTKCIRVVGNTARWTMEILLDKGIVEL